MRADIRSHRQRGMTLIEVIISLAISTVVIGAAVQLLLGSKQNYRMIEAMSRVQEDARYILDVMAVDVRMAGLRACGDDGSTANLLAGYGTDASLDFFTDPVLGFENGSGFSYTGLPSSGEGSKVSDSDVLWIKGLDTNAHYFAASHSTSTPKITLNTASNFALGEIAMVCQPGHHAVFQITAVGNGSTEISHQQGLLSPGNCSEYLGSPEPSTCGSGTGTAFAFGQIATLYRVTSQAYYVGLGSDGSTRSLFRARMRPNAAGTMSIDREELIPGVEDMEIMYGVDTDDDLVIDAYNNASAIADWNQVLAVRISLVFSSAEDNIIDEIQDYTIEGETVTPSDRRLRRVFSSTIGIRNRMP